MANAYTDLVAKLVTIIESDLMLDDDPTRWREPGIRRVAEGRIDQHIDRMDTNDVLNTFNANLALFDVLLRPGFDTTGLTVEAVMRQLLRQQLLADILIQFRNWKPADWQPEKT